MINDINSSNNMFETEVFNKQINHYKSVSWIKGKPIPLQAWAGPEGSRRFRLPDFKKFGT